MDNYKLPNMNQLSVNKDSIENIMAFNELVDLFHLTIIAEEQEYYILDGNRNEIKAFKNFWNVSN